MAAFDVKHNWAIIFFPSVVPPGRPFVKIPIVEGTDVHSLADSRGLTQYERLITHHGSIGTGHDATYRVFMLLHDNFMREMSGIVEIANGFFHYLYEWVDPSIHYDTAYAMTTSVFPPATRPDLAIRALLTADEVIHITRSPRQPGEIEPIRFWPQPPPESGIAR